MHAANANRALIRGKIGKACRFAGTDRQTFRRAAASALRSIADGVKLTGCRQPLEHFRPEKQKPA